MRVVIFVVGVVWAATSLPSYAASTKLSPQRCEQTAVTTGELIACAGSRAAEADAHLNKAYRDILRYVDGDERTKLVAAERAWLAFRDADCTFFGAGDGSISPVNEAFCRAGLAETRAKELESWPPNAPRSALTPTR